MTANNKKEFFGLLENELMRIGIEQTDDIFADFEEYFSDSKLRGISEENAAANLGDIKEIARGYLDFKSSQINSMVARDVERKKVSLTKPGRSVPADLSLMKGDTSFKNVQNSDCVRSYTPKHFSEEIYPNSQPNSTGANKSQGSQSVNNGANNGNNSNSANTSAGINQNGGNAFVNLGRALGTAAKAAGKAIADSGVKEAVYDAGKSAADVIKNVGHNAADAAKNAGHNAANAAKNAGQSAASAAKNAGHNAANAAGNIGSNIRQAAGGFSSINQSVTPAVNVSGAANVQDIMPNGGAQYQSVPHPSNSFRQHNTSSAKGTIPPQHTKAKTSGAYKFIDVSNMEMNVNVGRLVGAILLDLFVWIWVVPAVIGIVFAEALGALQLVKMVFVSFFGGGVFHYQYFLTRVFLSTAFGALSLMLVCLGVWTVKLFIRLCVFIINLHIRALYDI